MCSGLVLGFVKIFKPKAPKGRLARLKVSKLGGPCNPDIVGV